MKRLVIRGVFIAGIATAGWAWWMFAWPIMTAQSEARHLDHFAWVYAHMIGGSVMLSIGVIALYLGWTRQALRLHKRLGLTYLIGGSGGALMGLALSLRNPHGISGITVATGTLAVTWLVVAGLAFRAAKNRRFDAHRDWMIRSYVLTWTFAGCRMAGRVPALESMGDAGGAAIVWLSWVVPLLVCEFALQWRSTAAIDRVRRPVPE